MKIMKKIQQLIQLVLELYLHQLNVKVMKELLELVVEEFIEFFEFLILLEFRKIYTNN